MRILFTFKSVCYSRADSEFWIHSPQHPRFFQNNFLLGCLCGSKFLILFTFPLPTPEVEPCWALITLLRLQVLAWPPGPRPLAAEGFSLARGVQNTQDLKENEKSYCVFIAGMKAPSFGHRHSGTYHIVEPEMI